MKHLVLWLGFLCLLKASSAVRSGGSGLTFHVDKGPDSTVTLMENMAMYVKDKGTELQLPQKVKKLVRPPLAARKGSMPVPPLPLPSSSSTRPPRKTTKICSGLRKVTR